MKLIKFLARNSRKIIVMAVIAGIIAGACNTALLALISASFADSGSTGTRLAWAFAALCLLLPVTRFVSEYLLTRLGQGAMFDLRMQLSAKILRAPLKHLEQLGPHKLLATLTEDVPVITNALLIIPVLCINLTIIVGGFAYLGWLNWVLLLAVLGFMAVGVVSYQMAIKRASGPLTKARQEADELQKHFQGLTRGTKELKLHKERRATFLNEVLTRTAEAVKRHNIKGMLIFTAAGSWGQTVIIIIIGLTIFAMPDAGGINPGILVGYTLVLLYLMTPIQVLITSVPALGRADIAIKKIEELGLSLTSASTEREADSPAPTSWQCLELDSLTHTYRREGDDTDFTLGPIALRLVPGEIVFIIGGNGSGKTTLAKLLTGLYEPEQGSIRLDGQKVGDDNRDRYRQMFSAVFSDYYLFDSLMGIGGEGLDEKAREYLRGLELSRKVEVEGGRLSTTELSGGQRKRLALLTAYLEDRPIYVFDEWAADQDPVFKEVFYREVLRELRGRGKGVVVISHDDRYYEEGDRVVKLENGKVLYDRAVSSSQHASANTSVVINP
ncbi:MAG TPA: cyclic peptide export ABC transporter [Blastocatellia bacterium]|nr:cyclic peptide export ABC transporter [Blastocatellia bacterium]